MDELPRPVNRTVDMALGRQMHHRIGVEIGKGLMQRGAVADINVRERIALRMLDSIQRFQVARIGEFVDIQHTVARMGHDMTNYG